MKLGVKAVPLGLPQKSAFEFPFHGNKMECEGSGEVEMRLAIDEICLQWLPW
jgi:hypothetical protein